MTSPKSSADPVGAAMTRNEIIEQCARAIYKAKMGYGRSGISTEHRWELKAAEACAFIFAALSAPPVQAITEAMAEIFRLLEAEVGSAPGDVCADESDDEPIWRGTDAAGKPEVSKITFGLMRRARPAPSDDAQREIEELRGMNELLLKANKALTKDWPVIGSAPLSTLTEFKEACAKVAEDMFNENYHAYFVDAALTIAEAIRALPTPEPWRPIETEPE